ncbi:DUF6924 domain-containing protein [Streptomyces sp. NPDC057245]|uniref:DUF6924 domain-containing protein n=1 Tax=Streptomyces TaxID=1883 RepID=UPI001C1DDCA9|nr:hypothetical protein [Streptomyces sp. A108]MBU6530920.1 hypothetical protein [Streptomyces sp. A108]
MRVLPKTDEDAPPILVIRTDYRDDEAWQRLKAALDEPWVFDRNDEDGGLKEDILFVEDPSWTDADPADVLTALTAPEDGQQPDEPDELDESDECGWAVVFLADRAGMRGTGPTLLAVSTDPEEDTPPFRVAARSTPHEMHCNLRLANMDFSDFENWDGLMSPPQEPGSGGGG